MPAGCFAAGYERGQTLEGHRQVAAKESSQYVPTVCYIIADMDGSPTEGGPSV